MTQLQSKKISFIGGGNMAQALISGLIGKGVQPHLITVSDPSAKIREQLALQKINVVDPINAAHTAIKDADIVVLAVKPQVMRSVVAAFRDGLDKQLLISVAAGLSCDTLSNMLGGYNSIIRAMPNTPAMIQMGATGLYANDSITHEQKEQASYILGAAGLTVWVNDEEQMHAVTAVSGSAPAYFFYFLESMIAAAQALGLDEKQAAALAMQTALGSAKLAITSNDTPSELRRKVTSPNGTTQAAVESLQAAHLDAIVKDAMHACYVRSQQLSTDAIE